MNYKRIKSVRLLTTIVLLIVAMVALTARLLTTIVLLIVAMVALTACAYFPDAPEGLSEDDRVFTKIKDERMVAEATDYKGYIYKEGERAFCFRLKPPDLIEEGKVYPMVVFLHGMGDGGKDNSAHMYRSLIDSVKKYAPVDAYVFMPQANADTDWSDSAFFFKKEGLSSLYNACLDLLLQRYPVDTSRVYLTGMSMGGHGTVWQATTYPQKYAAVMPVCAALNWGSNPSMLPDITPLADMPTWLFHSRNDSAVDFQDSVNLEVALKELGNTNVKLSLFSEPLHDITALSYDNSEVWSWLFAQQKV